MRGSLGALIALLMVVACGSSPATSSGPSAASVAVQPGDVPSGMHRCNLSSDIDSFLKTVKKSSASTYTTTAAQWDAAKKSGAIAAQVVFYADSTAHCADLAANPDSASGATYKLVINYVIQFKDAASAAKGYTSESIFGFSAAALKTGGTPVIEGTATGLGANSIELIVDISNQSVFVAVWQNKVFMVILGVLDMDSATCKKMAVAENGQIH